MKLLKGDGAVKTYNFKENDSQSLNRKLEESDWFVLRLLEHSLKIKPRSDQNAGATGKTITSSGKALVSFLWHFTLVRFGTHLVLVNKPKGRHRCCQFVRARLSTCGKPAQVCPLNAQEQTPDQFF